VHCRTLVHRDDESPPLMTATGKLHDIGGGGFLED
jgi:hypothetical protein